jgi:hypothetical protein
VERNREAGQNPPRVVAPSEEEEEEEDIYPLLFIPEAPTGIPRLRFKTSPIRLTAERTDTPCTYFSVELRKIRRQPIATWS